MDKKQALDQIQKWMDAGIIEYKDIPKHSVGRPCIENDRKTACFLFEYLKKFSGRVMTKITEEDDERSIIKSYGRQHKRTVSVADGIRNLTGSETVMNRAIREKKGGPYYDEILQPLVEIADRYGINVIYGEESGDRLLDLATIQVLEKHWGFSDKESLQTLLNGPDGTRFEAEFNYLTDIYKTFPTLDTDDSIATNSLTFINNLFALGMGQEILSFDAKMSDVIDHIIALHS